MTLTNTVRTQLAFKCRKMVHFHRFSRSVLAGAIVSTFCFGSLAFGDTFGSNGGINLKLAGSWIDETVPGNTGILAPGVGDVARWDNNAGLANPTSFNLNGTTSWLGITVGNVGADITIANDGSMLNLGASGIDLSSALHNLTLGSTVNLTSSQTWNVSTGRVITDTNVISGTANLALNGLGTLVLSGNNTYVGSTMISSGKLQLGAGSNSGSVSGAIVDNGTLVLNRSDTVALGNAISGSGGFTQTGNGTVQLSASNSFTGAVAIMAGKVQLVGSGTLGAGAITNTLSVSSSATFDLNGNAAVVGALSGAGMINNSSGGATVLNILSGNSSFTGSVQNSGGGPLSLVKNGGGTLTLGGVSSYSGNTIINTGVLFVTNSSALGNTAGVNVNTIDGLQLGDGVIENAPITVNSGSNEFVDLPGSANATLGGNVVRIGTSQYRLGISGSGVLTVTGNQLGLNASTFITRGNITFAGNSTLSTGANPFVIGFATTPVNLRLTQNAAMMGNGVNFGSGQSAPSITVSLEDDSSLNLGAGNVELYGGTNPSGNVVVNLDGNSTLTAGSFTKSGTLQTCSINLNGGTLAAGASNSAFLPALANLSVNVGANGGTIDDNGFTVTVTQPLINQTAQPDGGVTKAGIGTVILVGANSYKGGTRILAGTLQLNNGGTITGPIINGGTLALNFSTLKMMGNDISGTGGLSQIGTGNVTLTGNYTATGAIALTNGNITFANTANLRNDTGVVIKSSSLSIATSSVLDVTNHDLIIGNSNVTTIQIEILNGFGDGPGGAAITSSTAIADGNKFLVPIDAATFGITSWDNVPITDPNTVIVKYTFFGDVNLDGQVDAGDYAALDGFFGPPAGPGGSIVGGDADLSGVVDAGDYAFLDNFFGDGVGNPLIAVSPNNVPEPASLSLLALAIPFLRRRRN